MKQIKIALFALFIVAGLNYAQAQKLAAHWDKLMVAIRATTWTAGAGWNIIDDNGNPWHKNFDAVKSWNCPPYPTKASLEGYYKKGFSFLFNFTYNSYKDRKLINGETHNATNFMAFDANTKYNFCELYDFNKLFGLGEKKIFDIYATGGLGYTYRHTNRVKGVATLNLGFGLNVWVYKNWGIQLESMSKFALVSPFFKTPANYLQYTFGVVYKFKLPPPSPDKRYHFNIPQKL